ncbi:MAG: hypothetical protein GC179_03715 [Anaerolineaceae bacterium]|nr:hypothetical protein [Anaerolineaceae bacterium]
MNYLPSPLARILQLAIPFELQNPDLNAADCARYINDVDHPRETFFSTHTIAASAVQSLEDEHHYYITIEHQYREASGWYTSARLDGELIRGANANSTIAIGKARISHVIIRRTTLFILLGLGAIALFGGIPTAYFLVWLVPIICFAIAAYQLWMGISDRNSLLSAVDYLMTYAHSLAAHPYETKAEPSTDLPLTPAAALNATAK